MKAAFSHLYFKSYPKCWDTVKGLYNDCYQNPEIVDANLPPGLNQRIIRRPTAGDLKMKINSPNGKIANK